jgi:hypothetical protein
MILILCTCACVFLYSASGSGILFAATIALGTTVYHFLMRLCTGLICNKAMKNRADLRKSRYRCRSWEGPIYEKLKVKRWKRRMPTYEDDFFDPGKHSWIEIAQASCQAETVHEVIILLSFVPVIFSIWVGEITVFMITSVLAAGIDMIFVIIQRYNRARIMKIIKPEK